MERKGMDGSGASGGEENLPVIENREDRQVQETSQFSMNSDRNQYLESAKSTADNDPPSKSKTHFDEIHKGPVPPAAGNTVKDQFRSSVGSQGQELPSPHTLMIPASSENNLVTNSQEVTLETKLPDANEPNETWLNEMGYFINETNSIQAFELREDPNNPYITHWDSDNDERCTPPIIEHRIRRISESLVLSDFNGRVLDYLSYLLEFPVEMISATNINLGAVNVQELASAMSTLIVETPEYEILTRTTRGRPLIPRFHKLLAMVKTLPVERVLAFLEYFNTRVIPNELGKLENEQLLLNIGLLMGSITLHFRQSDLGLDMLFNFLLCSPRCSYSFAHGLLSTNIFIIGYKNLCPFWDLCRKRQAVLIAIFKNPRFSDVRFAQPVIEMIQQRLNFKAPDITFDQFFDKFSEHAFTLKRDDNELNNCARILALLVVQNGTAYFEGPFTIQLDDWTKKWKSGTISNEGFACFIESFGIIAEALRGSDVPPATQKQQDVLMAIGNMNNVPPIITNCVNKSVWELLGAVGVPNKPFEKLEHEKPKILAQPGPTAAQGSSKKKLGSGSDKNQDNAGPGNTRTGKIPASGIENELLL